MEQDYVEVRESVEVEGCNLSTIWTSARQCRSHNRLAVLVHGGPEGNKDGPNDLFKNLAHSLGVAGIDTVRFDFRGQGESEGDYIDMTMAEQRRDFSAVLVAAANRGYTTIAAVGESFGATCVLGSYQRQFKSLVLLWPAIYLLDKCFRPFLEGEYQKQLARQGYIQVGKDRIGRSFLEELVQVDNLEDKLRQVNVPTLLIHGNQDTEVPFTQSVKANEILPSPKKLIIVPGGDHCLRRPAEQNIVINEVVTWLSSYL